MGRIICALTHLFLIQNDPFAREELGRKKKRAQKELRDKKRTGGLAVKFVAGHRKAFEECYIAFLQLPLTTPIYKARVLNFHLPPVLLLRHNNELKLSFLHLAGCASPNGHAYFAAYGSPNKVDRFP